jgi:hypothetical protein
VTNEGKKQKWGKQKAEMGAMIQAETGGATFRRFEVEGNDEFRVASTSPRGRILV